MKWLRGRHMKGNEPEVGRRLKRVGVLPVVASSPLAAWGPGSCKTPGGEAGRGQALQEPVRRLMAWGVWSLRRRAG